MPEITRASRPISHLFTAPSFPAPEDLAILSEDELYSCRRLSRPQDQAVYACAHARLRELLSHVLAVPVRGLHLGRENGPLSRPIVLGHDISVSVSHTRNVAAIAVHRDKVGIDVQAMLTARQIQILIRKFHPEEKSLLTSAGVNAAEIATRIWVRKEAFLKYKGVGLSRPLDLDDVVREPFEGGAELSDITAPSGYKAAICWT